MIKNLVSVRFLILSSVAVVLSFGRLFAALAVEPKDAVIYQVNFRAFSPGANIAGVQARLDDIQSLGANVLYLLPIYPIGMLKSINSPYCVRDYTAVNSDLGTLADLRAFVEEAHKRKMAVIFDWVADHTAWDNAWIENKSWYLQDAAGDIISPPNTGWNDVAALNFDNKEMREAMIEAMRYWVLQANIDGYRCDAADSVPFEFWKQAIASLNTIPGHKLLFFAEGARPDQFKAGFQLKYGLAFYGSIKDIFGGNASVLSIDTLNTTEYTDATPDDRVVRYISNHDVDQSDGTPVSLFDGKRGSLAAFVAAAYMKAAPMIYDGQEVGCPVKLQFMDNSTTIDWTLNPEMLEEYKKIIAFRTGSEAIKQGDLVSYSTADICAFTKSLNKDTVLVIVNLRNAAISYATPPALVGSAWKNAFEGGSVTLSDQVNLQPFQYLVLGAVK